MSTARTNAATTVPARTNQGAESPIAEGPTLGTKKAATPSCAIANAAAFLTDRNGTSAADDRTTRIG